MHSLSDESRPDVERLDENTLLWQPGAGLKQKCSFCSRTFAYLDPESGLCHICIVAQLEKVVGTLGDQLGARNLEADEARRYPPVYRYVVHGIEIREKLEPGALAQVVQNLLNNLAGSGMEIAGLVPQAFTNQTWAGYLVVLREVAP